MNWDKNSTQYLYDHISNKKQFRELALTREGRLLVDSAMEETADSFYIYYNGNVCCMQGAHQCCIGALPDEYLTCPTIVGETSFHGIEDSGCLLHSNQPVLEEETSVFAVFRYRDLLGLYMADSMVSKGIYFSLMEYTPEDEVLYGKLFQRMVYRHDPEAAETVAAWLKLLAANGKEV